MLEAAVLQMSLDLFLTCHVVVMLLDVAERMPGW